MQIIQFMLELDQVQKNFYKKCLNFMKYLYLLLVYQKYIYIINYYKYANPVIDRID